MCVTPLEPLVDHRPAKKKRFEKRMNACGGEGATLHLYFEWFSHKCFFLCMQALPFSFGVFLLAHFIPNLLFLIDTFCVSVCLSLSEYVCWSGF